MRIDRILTLSVVGPLRGLAAPRDARSIPILMYHSIADDVDDAVSPYYRTVTSPKSFARQIEVLRSMGFTAITLSRALHLLNSASEAAAWDQPNVVITFDDGFQDFYTDAFPILEHADFTATVFLPSAFVGTRFFTGRECLTATEVRTLSERGIEFGSHSVSHRRLVELGTSELAKELSDSKASIEDIVGREVTLFSYPFRFPEENPRYIGTLGRLLDECGYRGGVTNAIGRSTRQHDRRFLPRLPVNDCDDARLLQAKLSGDYDWLRAGQRMRKTSRALWNRWVRA